MQERLPYAEQVFRRNPDYWKNDVNFIRLAYLVEYLDRSVGIRYKEEHVGRTSILYTDPSDLFLNCVMDTRQGTCGNIPALLVAIGWRLGWPLSMACARAHHLCRYDDGRVRYNAEATTMGRGDGFNSPEDSQYIEWYKLTPSAVNSGSDLRALTPRETLGLFVGFRARHMQDSGNLIEAEKDYLLARYLFPTNHQLYFKGTGATLLRAAEMFAPDEEGAPLYWADCMEQLFGHSRRVIRSVQPIREAAAVSSAINVGYAIKL